MGTRSKQECESHYYKCYIENPKTPMIEFAEQNGQDLNFPTPITHKICDDPPRPALDSQMYNEMAGYMAGRGDFNTEYDNYAEHDICRMEFLEDDDDVDTNLKLSVLRIYNHRLHERARRKRILARYGLINIRKAGFSLRRYHSLIGSHVIDGLVGFMQLVEPVSFDLFTESLLHEAELKRKIKALQEFREAGLTRFFSTKLYSHLKQRRNDRKNKPRHLDNVLDHIQNKTRQNWLHRHIIAETKGGVGGDGIVPSMSKKILVFTYSDFKTKILFTLLIERKAAPPLEIEELEKLPGYEKINSDERELCSQVRLRPQDYIDIKEMLINECQKLGQIRLSNARTLIKIDVNKTRKIFDYLVAEGLIGTPSIKKS
uniref:SWIRM domain-containing protein n=1 Tax=Strigamia maritima TaxID=126957 RepID=T1J6F8_STRMM